MFRGQLVDAIDDVGRLAYSRGVRAEASPPPFLVNVPVGGISEEDAVDMNLPDLGDWEPGRLAGAGFGIEYVDATGACTVRRITALKLRYNAGMPLLLCWCHERGALRSFRLDRVRCCYDTNGEVFETANFLRSAFAIDINRIIEVVEPEDVFGNGLRILAALARVDGHLHPEELERMMQYCVSIYDHYGASMPLGLDKALPELAFRLRPTTVVVERSLRGLRRAAAGERRLFARYAVQVMDADSVQHPDEFALVQRLRTELGNG